jgi:hypothetical protein
VNWRRGWKIEEGMGDRPYDEWDDIKVFGTVRHHVTHRKGDRRKFQKVEVRLYPTHLPRDKWRDDPDAVGGVYAEKGILHAGVYLAADALLIVPCFANHYRKLFYGEESALLEEGCTGSSSTWMRRLRRTWYEGGESFISPEQFI